MKAKALSASFPVLYIHSVWYLVGCQQGLVEGRRQGGMEGKRKVREERKERRLGRSSVGDGVEYFKGANVEEKGGDSTGL